MRVEFFIVLMSVAGLWLLFKRKDLNKDYESE
jgi:hypothetical protein